MYTDAAGRKWYKGNLHMHTTESDGIRTPEEAFELYAARGYDFVARTDHWKPSPGGRYKNMLLLPGCEYDTGKPAEGGMFHFVSIGAKTEPHLVRRAETPQHIVDEIKASGALVDLAHPAWSLETPEQFMSVRGVDFTEIYNSVSGPPWNCRPDSSLLFDMCASVHGFTLPLIAADDVHFYTPEETCRSFIWLQAEELTEEAVMEALRAGRFYPSQGPRLSVRREEDRILVDCDPVDTVVFFTDRPWEKNRNTIGKGLTHAEFALSMQRFVRVEVIAEDGRRAWSQYIPLD